MSPVTRSGGVVPAGSISDSELASPTAGAYREVISRWTGVGDPLAAATYIFYSNGAIATSASLAPVGAIYLDPADYAVAGLTTKYRIVSTCAVNGTAPARTMTIGLHAMTAVTGGADALTGTFSAATSGSTVEYASPLANTLTASNSGDFTAPAAGYYGLGYVLAGGSITADSYVVLTARLQVRNV